jgi:hypothetical protein
MIVSKDEQTFRMPRWLTGFLSLMTLVCGVGAIFLIVAQGIDAISLMVAAVGFTLAVGTLDAIRTRVTLHGEEIIIVRGFRRRRLFRGHIDEVTWNKDTGISLHLDDGMWVTLPDVGDSKAHAASIRAWVERARRTE